MSQRPINFTEINTSTLQDSGIYPVETGLKTSVLEQVSHSSLSILTKASKRQLFVCEGLAMFTLVLLVNLTVDAAQANAQTVLGVFFAVVLCGYLSGANLNMAVTLANVLKKENKFTKRMLPLYFVAQVLGTIAAQGLAHVLLGRHLGAVLIQEESVEGCWRLMASEITGSFFLVFLILQVTNPNTTYIQNELSGYLAVVLIVNLARLLSIRSGQANNIVIIWMNNVVAAVLGEKNSLVWIPAWIFAQIIGVTAATLLYDHLYEPIIKRCRQEKRQFVQVETMISNVE